jgi:glutamate dehydrogenase
MTEDVANLVLTNNFRQVQALSIAQRHVGVHLAEYQRFMTRMESDQRLDRTLEGVPTDEVLADRATRGESLTRPELAVLLSYAKTYIKERLIDSSIHADAVIADSVFEEFPPVIQQRFAAATLKHRLYRDILATIVANDVVHHLGISSLVHLAEFVGGEAHEIVRAYFAAARCFEIRETFRSIEGLVSVDGETRLDMLLQVTQLARRATRWFLRHRRRALDVAALTQHFAASIADLSASRMALMGVSGRARHTEQIQRWTAAGVTMEVALLCANAAALVTTLPVIDAAERRAAAPRVVAQVFATLNSALSVDWLVDQIASMTPSSLWQAMERDLLVDDLMTNHALLAASINADLVTSGTSGTDAPAIERWLLDHQQFARAWRAAIDSAQRATTQDFSLFSMTYRKLGDLRRTLVV